MQRRDPRRLTVTLTTILLLLSGLPVVARAAQRPSTTTTTTATTVRNTPEVLLADDRVSLRFGPEQLVLPRGLQPSLLATQSGALIVQAQVPDKPFPSTRMAYFSAMSTVVSRDGGASWTAIPLKPGENGL